jgi:branched-chain amino acid transport system ATP-binding protein
MLRLDGVTAGYGEVVALRNADLIVPPGTVAALVGPNGAGKTTLLRVASGLMVPQSGRVSYQGRDLTGKPAQAVCRAGVCLVPEGRGIFAGLTVREHLRLFAAPGEEAAAVRRASEAFPRLGERLNQPVGTMSGGEQQMVALARAYVQRPSVVLLDEVSMGLAPKIVDDIFSFLKKLADEGIALLVVEQFVGKVLALADIVYVMNRGEVVFSGDTGEITEAELVRYYLGTDVTTTSR